jgi:hypothetical protein
LSAAVAWVVAPGDVAVMVVVAVAAAVALVVVVVPVAQVVVAVVDFCTVCQWITLIRT